MSSKCMNKVRHVSASELEDELEHAGMHPIPWEMHPLPKLEIYYAQALWLTRDLVLLNWTELNLILKLNWNKIGMVNSETMWKR